MDKLILGCADEAAWTTTKWSEHRVATRVAVRTNQNFEGPKFWDLSKHLKQIQLYSWVIPNHVWTSSCSNLPRYIVQWFFPQRQLTTELSKNGALAFLAAAWLSQMMGLLLLRREKKNDKKPRWWNIKYVLCSPRFVGKWSNNSLQIILGLGFVFCLGDVFSCIAFPWWYLQNTLSYKSSIWV